MNRTGYVISKIIFGFMVIGAYYIYTYTCPGTDGIVFGSTLLLLGLLAGISWNELKHLRENFK